MSFVLFACSEGGCRLEGNTWLEFGDQRITECESVCICLPNGTLNCEELCPGRISVNSGDQSNCSGVPAGEEYDECCTNLVCTDGESFLVLCSLVTLQVNRERGLQTVKKYE